MKRFGILVLGAFLMGVPATHADVRLPKVFSSQMVLQRDIPAPVWGWADPGETVTVEIADQSVSTTADRAGRWLVKLSPLSAGWQSQLMVQGKSTVAVNDILVGDVWICAGQSNMELALKDSHMARWKVPAAKHPEIRLLNLKPPRSAVPLSDIPEGWKVCSPGTASGFSAVGYFFGARIQQETGVPIGLIGNAAGGSPIEPWMNVEGMKSVPELFPIWQEYEKKVTAYRGRLAALVDPAARWVEQARAAQARGEPVPVPLLQWPKHPASDLNVLTSLYNSRIAPLVPFGIKGVIWYQGEANARTWDTYYDKMRGLVGGWRQVWEQGEFPFYFVQLPNYMRVTQDPAGGDGWARIRMAQARCLQIPRTGMAVTIDIGESGTNHPPNKKDVGYRLAFWALANDYGQTNRVFSGPLYKAALSEGRKIRITFDHADCGLMVGKKETHGPVLEDPHGKLRRFAIAGPDRKWHWADAVIDGSTVLVSSEAVETPAAVRYAFAMNPEGCNLYNKAGLPCSPFKTDEW